MKKLILSLAVLSAIVSCSSDDDNGQVNNCDCQKVFVVYNETSQTWDPVANEFYSNNCNDDMGVVDTDENGDHYIINCTPNE